MPIEYTIDPAHAIVYVHCRDLVTYDDLRSYSARLRSDPQFKNDFSAYVDTSKVEDFELSYRLLAEYRRTLDPYAPSARRVVVAPGNLSFGIARMYQALVEGGNFQVFRTAEEANSWMNLPADVNVDDPPR